MWYLHGKIKHWQLTWFSCDITCARTFDQGHTGQGEVRNSRPHHYHHQHQQTIVVFSLLCMLVSWFVGQQVWWMWNCGEDGHSLDSFITSRPAPIQRMLNNQHQQQGYAFVQQSPVWCAMMDGFSHRGAVRKLTLSRQIPSDTFQPAIACLLSNGLSAIMDDCEAFLMIASNIGTDMGLFTYRVIENGGPKDSPCAYDCYKFLLLLPLCHEKSCFGWPPHSPPHCPS